jgi:hypothetical protein
LTWRARSIRFAERYPDIPALPTTHFRAIPGQYVHLWRYSINKWQYDALLTLQIRKI